MIILFIIFSIICFLIAYLYDKKKKESLICEPTRKILELIKEGRFSYIEKREKGVKYIILKDLKTGNQTRIDTFYLCEGTHTTFSGDLSWMNKYERDSVAELVVKLLVQKQKVVEEEQRKRTEKLNEERRQEAMEIYK